MAERYISFFSHPPWKEKTELLNLFCFRNNQFRQFFQTRAVLLDLVSVTFLQNDGNAETENVEQIYFFHPANIDTILFINGLHNSMFDLVA